MSRLWANIPSRLQSEALREAGTRAQEMVVLVLMGPVTSLLDQSYQGRLSLVCQLGQFGRCLV